VDVTAGTTVADLVAQARRRFDDEDRMVVGLRTDDRDVSLEQIDDVLRTVASSYRRVDLLTCDRRTMVADALDHAVAACADCDTARYAAADLLAEGRTPDAMQQLGECLRLWSDASQTLVKSAALMQRDLAEVATSRGTAAVTLDGVAAHLRELRDALQAGDHVRTADVLRYEMDSTMQELQAAMRTLREAIADPAPAST
jgi:hypothetical protein